MARTPVPLDVADTTRGFTLLLHSLYGAGKTHFAGTALLAESAHGPVRYVNVAGEDGYNTIAGIGLGDVAETIDTRADYDALLADYRKRSLRLVVIDSLKHLIRIDMEAQIGPRPPRSGDNKSNEWGPIHFSAENLFNSTRGLAKYVIVTCPSDKYTNDITGATSINPDLPGRQSRLVVGCFDFVAYLQTTPTGPGRMTRTLQLTHSAAVTTRQRWSHSVPDVVIPEGKGGWAAFMSALSTPVAGRA